MAERAPERLVAKIEQAPASSRPAIGVRAASGSAPASGELSGRVPAAPVPEEGASAPKAAAAPRVSVAAQKHAAGAQAADEAQATDKAQATVETSAPAGAGVLDRLSDWFAETFPHSRYAVLGGIAGLVVALLLFWIGVLKTLVIVVLVVVGVAIGQYLDGDPRLIRIVQGLVKRR